VNAELALYLVAFGLLLVAVVIALRLVWLAWR
jgi:hypothetical protein